MVVHGLYKNTTKNIYVPNWWGWMDTDTEIKLPVYYITFCKLPNGEKLILSIRFLQNVLFSQKGMDIIWFHFVYLN